VLRQGSEIELAKIGSVIETSAFIRKRFFSTQNRMRCSRPEQRARNRVGPTRLAGNAFDIALSKLLFQI
jgi:hypothetical protein